MHQATKHETTAASGALDTTATDGASELAPSNGVTGSAGRPRRVPGGAVGLITVLPGFNDPLPDELLAQFER